jgi:hypothetical protein
MTDKWQSLTDWFNSIGNDPQIADPLPWASMQPQNQPGYLFVCEREISPALLGFLTLKILMKLPPVFTR